jgi:hypothetical protein
MIAGELHRPRPGRYTVDRRGLPVAYLAGKWPDRHRARRSGAGPSGRSQGRAVAELFRRDPVLPHLPDTAADGRSTVDRLVLDWQQAGLVAHRPRIAPAHGNPPRSRDLPVRGGDRRGGPLPDRHWRSSVTHAAPRRAARRAILPLLRISAGAARGDGPRRRDTGRLTLVR